MRSSGKSESNRSAIARPISWHSTRSVTSLPPGAIYGNIRLVQEALAWQWALSTSLLRPLPPVKRLIHECLRRYANGISKYSHWGTKAPPPGHLFWRLLEDFKPPGAEPFISRNLSNYELATTLEKVAVFQSCGFMAHDLGFAKRTPALGQRPHDSQNFDSCHAFGCGRSPARQLCLPRIPFTHKELAMDPLLTTKQLAEVLGVSERHIHRQKAAGKLPSPIRIGRCLRWNRNDFVRTPPKSNSQEGK